MDIEKKELENLYYDSVDYELVKLCNYLIKHLKKGSSLISYKECNVYQRDTNNKILNTVDRWFSFILDDWFISFSPADNWIFNGIYIDAFKNNNGTYKRDCYPINIIYDKTKKEEILDLLNNPEKINKRQEKINCFSGSKAAQQEVLNYVNRSRKIEKHIFK